MLLKDQLNTIFALQAQLDSKIAKIRELENIKNDILSSRFLALLVEIAELANEVRCFKYWSSKPMSNKKILLEEYSDGLHFIISIAISLNLSTLDCQYEEVVFTNLNLAFLALIEKTVLLFNNKNGINLNQWLNIYYSIAKLIGFSGSDIYQAYLTKNKINHQRQEENY